RAVDVDRLGGAHLATGTLQGGQYGVVVVTPEHECGVIGLRCCPRLVAVQQVAGHGRMLAQVDLHRAERVATVGHRLHATAGPDVAGEAQAVGEVAARDAAFRGHAHGEVGGRAQFVRGQGVGVGHDPCPYGSSFT